MKRTRFYAVKRGRKKGIYISWNECKRQVEGYSRPIYKGFETIEEAEAFFDSSQIGNGFASDVDFATAYTGGCFSTEKGIYSFGCVLISPDGKVNYHSGFDNDPEFLSSKKVAGELMSVKESIAWAYKNEFKNLLVIHALEGVSTWANGLWSANTHVSRNYVDFVSRFREDIDIRFCCINEHDIDQNHGIAELLAQSACKLVEV